MCVTDAPRRHPGEIARPRAGGDAPPPPPPRRRRRQARCRRRARKREAPAAARPAAAAARAAATVGVAKIGVIFVCFLAARTRAPAEPTECCATSRILPAPARSTAGLRRTAGADGGQPVLLQRAPTTGGGRKECDAEASPDRCPPMRAAPVASRAARRRCGDGRRRRRRGRRGGGDGGSDGERSSAKPCPARRALAIAQGSRPLRRSIIGGGGGVTRRVGARGAASRRRRRRKRAGGAEASGRTAARARGRCDGVRALPWGAKIARRGAGAGPVRDYSRNRGKRKAASTSVVDEASADDAACRQRKKRSPATCA